MAGLLPDQTAPQGFGGLLGLLAMLSQSGILNSFNPIGSAQAAEDPRNSKLGMGPMVEPGPAGPGSGGAGGGGLAPKIPEAMRDLISRDNYNAKYVDTPEFAQGFHSYKPSAGGGMGEIPQNPYGDKNSSENAMAWHRGQFEGIRYNMMNPKSE